MVFLYLSKQTRKEKMAQEEDKTETIIWYCPICKEEFMSEIEVKEHYEIHLICDICGKKLKSRIRRNEHVRTVHDKQYFCKWCGLNFGKRNKCCLHEKNCKQNPVIYAPNKVFLCNDGIKKPKQN